LRVVSIVVDAAVGVAVGILRCTPSVATRYLASPSGAAEYLALHDSFDELSCLGVVTIQSVSDNEQALVVSQIVTPDQTFDRCTDILPFRSQSPRVGGPDEELRVTVAVVGYCSFGQVTVGYCCTEVPMVAGWHFSGEFRKHCVLAATGSAALLVVDLQYGFPVCSHLALAA
jgi:hypothetical protein